MPKLISRKTEKMTPMSKLLPTGSTLLNLACADNPFGGFGKGMVIRIIGDRSTSKTFLVLTGLAAIANDKRYDKYKLVYDDAEKADRFHYPTYFGKNLQDRLDRRGSPIIEDYYIDVLNLLEDGDPFVHALDTYDYLSSVDERARAAKMKRKGKTEKDYERKPKIFKEMFRVIKDDFESSGSVLIVVNQVIENLNRGPFEKKYTVTGGQGLSHATGIEIWLQIVKRKTEKELEVGQYIRAHVTKNKITGKHRKVDFLVRNEYGVDDIGSQIDWLVENKYWKKPQKKIKAVEFDIEVVRNDLITHIEENNLEKELQKITGKAWLKKEATVKPNRKPRFK
jgi:RecA/RadA recombinase